MGRQEPAAGGRRVRCAMSSCQAVTGYRFRRGDCEARTSRRVRINGSPSPCDVTSTADPSRPAATRRFRTIVARLRPNWSLLSARCHIECQAIQRVHHATRGPRAADLEFHRAQEWCMTARGVDSTRMPSGVELTRAR
jgi:hypothetical protein